MSNKKEDQLKKDSIIDNLNRLDISYVIKNRRLDVTNQERLAALNTYKYPGYELRAALMDPLAVHDRKEEMELQRIEGELRSQLYQRQIAAGEVNMEKVASLDPTDLSFKFDYSQIKIRTAPEEYHTTIDMDRIQTVRVKHIPWSEPDLIITTTDPQMWTRLKYILYAKDETGQPVDLGAKVLDIKFTPDRRFAVFVKVLVPWKYHDMLFWHRPGLFNVINPKQYNRKYIRKGEKGQNYLEQYRATMKLIEDHPDIKDEVNELKKATREKVKKIAAQEKEEQYEFAEDQRKLRDKERAAEAEADQQTVDKYFDRAREWYAANEYNKVSEADDLDREFKVKMGNNRFYTLTLRKLIKRTVKNLVKARRIRPEDEDAWIQKVIDGRLWLKGSLWEEKSDTTGGTTTNGTAQFLQQAAAVNPDGNFIDLEHVPATDTPEEPASSDEPRPEPIKIDNIDINNIDPSEFNKRFNK